MGCRFRLRRRLSKGNRGAASVSHDAHLQQKTPWQVWCIAAFGAIALHVGCVALAVEYMRDDAEQASGAIAIEIGVELAVPRLSPTDLPPGPEADASTFSPEVMAQKPNVEQDNKPKAIPTETEDPDRVVSPNDPKEVTEEEKVTTTQAAPSVLSIASEAAAPPSSEEVQEAPRSVAPALGVGDSARLIRVAWQKELIAHFDKHKRYPTDRDRQTAEILVSFSLDRTGHILATGIVRGSGDGSFDQAALAMLQRSNPVPPPPPVIADDGLSFTLPVIFRVKGRN